jgi:hypothetical protein
MSSRHDNIIYIKKYLQLTYVNERWINAPHDFF